MYAELHCHTLFSVDARGAPEELVDAAAQRGVETLALTEHNHLGSLERARQRAAQRGIACLPGVELDAVWRGRNFHFLALGFDPDSAPLRQKIEKNHDLYARRFDLYLEQLQVGGYTISKEQLEAELVRRYPSHPTPVLNQWFAGEVLVSKGVFPSAEAYNKTLEGINRRIVAQSGEKALGHFASFREILKAVHAAGGILLLAHVAKYFPGNAQQQIVLIQTLIGAGMDGFELYHPVNRAEPHFDRLVLEAEHSGCAISGGSDCHHALGEGANAIGCSRVPEEIMASINAALAKRHRKKNKLKKWLGQ